MFWHKRHGHASNSGNSEGDNGFLALNTGVLRGNREEVKIRWKDHMFIGDTKDGGFAEWVDSVEGTKVKRWKAAEGGEEVQLGWRSASALSAPASDSLSAHCHCHGVSFRLTRPSLPASSNLHSPLPDTLAKTDPDSCNAASWWLPSESQYLAGTCSCESCRLCSGAEVVGWAFVPAVNIQVPDSSDGDVNGENSKPYNPNTTFGTLKPYTSSPDVTRYFCKVCGCGVFWTGQSRPELIDVAVGILDAQEGARAESWLKWVKERVSFEEEAGDVGLVQEVGSRLASFKQRWA